MSCDRALRFLTQVQRSARINEDFVTDVFFSTGGGTRRDIANEYEETRCIEAKAKLKEAMKVRADASKKRATIRWHLSLELVTTGMAKTSPIKPLLNFLDCGTGAGLFCSQKRKILKHALICHHYFPRSWLFSGRKHEEQERQQLATPILFSRGWRSSPSFLRRDLYQSNPNFSWAHPYLR
jgi:hypothetical protein